MGFWRGVGYFISILMIIGGILGALFTSGLSLVSAILGFIFIWMLKRSASQERMEKYLKEMRDSIGETAEQRIDRRYNEDQTHCAVCGKWLPMWSANPCKKCMSKEMELSDAKMELADDEKKSAGLEKEKSNRENKN